MEMLLRGGSVAAGDDAKRFVLRRLKAIDDGRRSVREPDWSSIVNDWSDGGFKEKSKGLLRATPG